MTVTDTNTENHTDLDQCTYKTDKGWRCKLTAGHEDAHRMILRGELAKPKPLAQLREEVPSLKGFKLTMQPVPKSEDLRREYHREAEPRDADQLRVDKDATVAYEKWVAAGKPEKFEASPVQRYIFPPEAFDTVVLMIRRATQVGGPVQGKRLSYRRKTHESGDAMIYFRITDAKVGEEESK